MGRWRAASRPSSRRSVSIASPASPVPAPPWSRPAHVAPCTRRSRMWACSAVARCRRWGRSHSRTTGCSSWMNGRSSAATSWRSCGNRSRRVSSKYHLQSVLNSNDFFTLALRLRTERRSGWESSQTLTTIPVPTATVGPPRPSTAGPGTPSGFVAWPPVRVRHERLWP
jgi:hypothetical protein